MATYWAIQRLVKQQADFVPKTCWIADVKEQLGLPVRRAFNRVTEERLNPCPIGRRGPIEKAIRSLNRTQSDMRIAICGRGGPKWSR